MANVNPFIPDPEFLERRAQQMASRERRRQDAKFGGWERDRERGGRGFADLIDKQRGQLAEIFVAGGRFGAYDRKAALKQFIQMGALALRAAEIVMSEIHEAKGEGVDDGLLEMFELPRENAESVLANQEMPF